MTSDNLKIRQRAERQERFQVPPNGKSQRKIRTAMKHALPILCFLVISTPAVAAELKPLEYNNPGLTVDLGVGLWAWPLPMDFDGDGDNDLVVVCPDKPSNGTYFFENTSGNVKFPVFKPGRRISRGLQNVQVSYVNGEPRVMSPASVYLRF